MFKSKLISLLKSFTHDEIREFNKFVNSPYFNNERTVQVLVSLLTKEYPGFNEKRIEKEKIFSKIYPGKKINDSILRNIVSRTLKLAERFLVQKKFEESPYYNLNLKLRVLGDKNQSYLFEKARENGEQFLNEVQIKDSSYYHARMIFEDELRRFAMRQKSNVYLPDDNYQNIIDNCINFFSAELMQGYAVMINADKHLKEYNFDFRFLYVLMKYYEDNRDYYKDMYYVHLYYNSIKLFTTEEEQYFDKVYDIAINHYEQLTEIDKKNAYVVLGNYCSEKINKGELKFLRKRFELNKEILLRKAYYEGLPYMSHVFYNRVAYNAINLGELEWARDFMEKFKNELPDEHRENTFYMSMSEYYLKLQKYDEAIEALSHVQRLDRLYKQEVYALSLKIFYSSDQTEAFYSELASYRSFLRTSNLISDRNRKLDSNFIKLIHALHKLKESKKINGNPDIPGISEEKIINEYSIEKIWLLEKLRELNSPVNSYVKITA
jgi:hypothetical protein